MNFKKSINRYHRFQGTFRAEWLCEYPVPSTPLFLFLKSILFSRVQIQKYLICTFQIWRCFLNVFQRAVSGHNNQEITSELFDVAKLLHLQMFDWILPWKSCSGEFKLQVMAEDIQILIIVTQPSHRHFLYSHILYSITLC